MYVCLKKVHHTTNMLKMVPLILKHWLPFDDEADPVALVQDAFELGNSICAGSLEGDLVRDADDLHGPWVTGYFAIGDRHHVI